MCNMRECVYILIACVGSCATQHAGFDPLGDNNTGSFDCDAIFHFKGGCVWPLWHYYDLQTMEVTKTCGDFDDKPGF